MGGCRDERRRDRGHREEWRNSEWDYDLGKQKEILYDKLGVI